MFARIRTTFTLLLLFAALACGGGGSKGGSQYTHDSNRFILTSVAPAIAAPGDSVTVTVTGSQSLNRLAFIKVGGLDATITAFTYGSPVITATFLVPAGAPEGALSLDLRTNEYTLVAPAALTVDFNIPVWHPAFPLSTDLIQSSSNGNWPALVATSGGRALAVWVESFGGQNVAWACFRAPGGTWGTKAMLSDRQGQLHQPLAAALNEAGQAVVVMKGYFLVGDGITGDNLAAVTYDPATGWSGPVLLDRPPSSGVSGTAVAMAEDGRALAVWIGGDPGQPFVYSGFVRSSQFTPDGGWSPATNLPKPEGTTVNHLRPAFQTADGKVLVVWETYEGGFPPDSVFGLTVCEYQWSTGWGAPTVAVVPGALSPQSAAVAGDAQGRRLLAWIGGPDVDHLVLRSSRYVPGQGWQPLADPVATRPVSKLLPDYVDSYGMIGQVNLAMNGSGAGLVAWTHTTGACLRPFDPVDGWGADVELVGPGTAGGNAFPAVAINTGGDAAVSWVGFSRKGIYGTWYSDAEAMVKPHGGTWTLPRRIDRTGITTLSSPGTWTALDDQGQGLFLGWCYEPQIEATDFGGVWSSTHTVQAGFSTQTYLTNRGFGQAANPRIEPDGMGGFLVNWEQTERAFRTPWGVRLPAINPTWTDTDAILRGSVKRPFTCDDRPAGNCGQVLAFQDSTASLGSTSPSVAAAWLENHQGHWRLRANSGGTNNQWQNARTDANAASQDADELGATSLEPGINDAPPALGVFRKTNSAGTHEIWSFCLQNAYLDGLTSSLLSPAGQDVDGLVLASNAKDRAQAFWQLAGVGGSELWTSEYAISSRAWSVPVKFAPAPPGASAPQATVDVAGNRMVAWLQGGTALWASMYTPASGWSTSVPLAQPGLPILEFSRATDGAGTFAVAWSQGSGEAWGRICTPALGWGAPIRLSEPGIPARGVKVGLDATGDVVFAWLGGTAQEVYGALWDPVRGLSAASPISSAQGPCDALDLRVAQGRYALAVWTQVQDGAAQVWASCLYH